MQNVFDEHGVNVTELMLIGQIFALLFTWQIQQKEGNFYQSLREKYGAIVDDFSPRLKPGVSWVRTKQETPNALPTPLAPPFLPIAKARGISEDLDELSEIIRREA